MNYLISLHNKPVGTDINSVNARELHNFLGARKVYANWIKDRIAKYGFVENQDYIVILTKKDGNNATLKEYYITLDMAKELAMVENNEKGREARRYFIEVEKQYKQSINHYQIAGYKSQIAQKNKLIEQLKNQLNHKHKTPYDELNRRYNNLVKLYEKAINEAEDLKQERNELLGKVAMYEDKEALGNMIAKALKDAEEFRKIKTLIQKRDDQSRLC